MSKVAFLVTMRRREMQALRHGFAPDETGIQARRKSVLAKWNFRAYKRGIQRRERERRKRAELAQAMAIMQEESMSDLANVFGLTPLLRTAP